MNPRNTHEKKFGTHEYTREKTLDLRNTHEGTMHYTHVTHDSMRPMQFSTLELMWVISKIIFFVSTLSEMCVISHAFVINVYSKTFLDLYTKDIVGSEILNIHVFFLYKQRSFFNSASMLLNNHHNHNCT